MKKKSPMTLLPSKDCLLPSFPWSAGGGGSLFSWTAAFSAIGAPVSVLRSSRLLRAPFQFEGFHLGGGMGRGPASDILVNVCCGTRAGLGAIKLTGRGAAGAVQWGTGSRGQQGTQHVSHSRHLESHAARLSFWIQSEHPTLFSHPGLFVPGMASSETQKKNFFFRCYFPSKC